MEEDRYGNLRRYSAESNSLVRDCLKGALLTLIREKSYKDISVSELCRKAGPEIALHIPSDTVLEPERLNDSLREARAFLAARFPEFAQAPVTCVEE